MKIADVVKNEEEELPVPHLWRPTFKAVVDAFVKGDYQLSSGINKVTPVSVDTAKQIKEYIDDYGEELIELPDETWNTSTYLYQGSYWSVFIDLFTKNEDLSDLVLSVEVREDKDDFKFDIYLVYVP